MDVWLEMKKIMHRKLPDCYSFLPEYSRELVDNALKISNNEHKEKLQMCKNYVDHYQYAVGGEGLHRGYYCPSLIRDIVVGNCNRGRLVKDLKRTRQNISYEYGFCNGKLQLVIYYANKEIYEIEYISYYGEKQIGYTFDNTFTLKRVSECVYKNNKLMSYLLVDADSVEPFVGIEKEVYEYDNGVMCSATIYLMYALNFCRHEKYIFTHDKDGFLSSYKIIEYVDGKEKEDFYWKDHWFKVYKKRKA